MKASVLIGAFLVLSLISCRKHDGADLRLFSTWEATNFVSLESVAYPKNEGTKILLIFHKSGIYQLKLDINNCGGTFISGSANQLKLTSPGCTKVCCDSQFSDKLVSMLSSVASYSINKNALKLNVPQWGYLEFELVK